MNDKIKLIVLGLGGFVIGLGLMIGIFWMVLSRGGKAAAEQTAQPGGQTQQTMPAQQSVEAMKERRVPGGEVLAFADVLGENIPLEPTVSGFSWATWGMTLQQVLEHLGQEGATDTVIYQPATTEFISVVALNPDPKRFKIEYRFYNNALFHIEIFYSDFYKNNAFNAFLLSKMSEYGRPYEQFATVDDMGDVILHAKWDTEESLIELVGRPDGHFSLFLDSQVVLIQLEEARKAEERLTY